MELLRRPALELAALVRGGEVTAGELVAASLAAIEAAAAVNAFVDVHAEEAQAAAAAIGPGDPRPFAGVPIAIKANRAVAGWRLTHGARRTGDARAVTDHGVVARLRAAGFVLVGSTTMPEYGITATTEPARSGPTRNPLDLTRTAGGSSGGSGAAVAAGLVPIAHGNDGGGSLRVPAACCGLVALKPQRGRVSLAPDAGWSLLVQDGVLTRTVADTAAALDVLAGPAPGDLAWAPPPAEPFAATAARPPGRLRIAVTQVPLWPAPALEPARARALGDTAARLAALGHDVEPADPPWGGGPDRLDTFTDVFAPAIAAHLPEAREDEVEPLTWALLRHARALRATDAVLAVDAVQGLARDVLTWMAPYDAVLTPALNEAPVLLGTIDTGAADPWSAYRRAAAFNPYAPVANLTGQPAIALPVGRDEHGLPLAVQLLGRPAAEGALLSLAAQVERIVQ